MTLLLFYSSKELGNGTGLGLSVVYGGWIGLDTEDGKEAIKPPSGCLKEEVIG